MLACIGPIDAYDSKLSKFGSTGINYMFSVNSSNCLYHLSIALLPPLSSILVPLTFLSHKHKDSALAEVNPASPIHLFLSPTSPLIYNPSPRHKGLRDIILCYHSYHYLYTTSSSFYLTSSLLPTLKVSPQYTKTTYHCISTLPLTPPTSPKPNGSGPAMAVAPRQVGFAPIPATYSRLPHDDELYVMKAFARHASHCSPCAHPYEVHRKGGSLCSKGHQRALDVTQYVFNKAGQTFSVVDLEGDRRVQMEIPVDCAVVRELLKAMERGLRLRRKVPVPSETYHVPPRVIQPTTEHRRPQAPQSIRKPTLETAMPPSSRREKRSHSGRGSLYEADMKERERRYKSRPTYYSARSRGALPVPDKDDEYYY